MVITISTKLIAYNQYIRWLSVSQILFFLHGDMYWFNVAHYENHTKEVRLDFLQN